MPKSIPLSRQAIRVLVIAPYRFLPAINGGHKAIERLYNHLGLLVDVMVVSVKSNSESSSSSYRLIKLFSDSPLHYVNPFLFFRLKRLIRNEGITHVITEHPYMGWLAFLLKQTCRVLWIMRSHNIEALRFKTVGKWWWKLMWYYEKWVCRNTDNIFFITQEDKQWAVENYSLPKEKGTVITYGIDKRKAPSTEERNGMAHAIRNQYGIPDSNTILLFNGDLGYEPNREAVQIIIEKIYPLLKQSGFAFTILICGRNLPDSLAKAIKTTSGNIIYTGFVNDITQTLLASDIFINPVISGGGIKTKLVEALSYGCSAISTVSGATGVPLNTTNNALVVVANGDWAAFTNGIANVQTNVFVNDVFYNHFYWGNIARKAASELESLQAQ